MTNEEFQKAMLTGLENLSGGQKQLEAKLGHVEARLGRVETGQKQLDTRLSQVETGQKQLDTRLSQVETGQKQLDTRLGRVETGQDKIQQTVAVIMEQTAELTEFRQEMGQMLKDIRAVIVKLEMTTADNRREITVLKSSSR
ncbi:MAG TPA: hypothetical protein DDW86_02640 [Clostridiales bacterium]|jgi:uncharacterized phage infection (PIP) family protein YhgE|nr:hypothetical protein [Clostridiales bacterium]